MVAVVAAQTVAVLIRRHTSKVRGVEWSECECTMLPRSEEWSECECECTMLPRSEEWSGVNVSAPCFQGQRSGVE